MHALLDAVSPGRSKMTFGAPRIARGAVLLWAILLSMAGIAAPAGPPPIPPASFAEDFIDAISEAGGPDLSGNMRFENLSAEGGRSYVANLDKNGNPDPKGQWILRAYLCYNKGGTSGASWSCDLEIVAPTGEITNAAGSHPDSDLLAKLSKESDEKYPLYNDEDVAAQFNKELPRTKDAAIKEAFKRLNQGLRGRVRLTMKRDSSGHGVREGGRSGEGPNKR